jgi:chromate transporter
MEAEEKLRRALITFLVMIKIGAFTYGGGWSIVAQFQSEFIDKRHWLTENQLMDFVAIGRSLPGIVVLNYAVILGYHVGGVLCACLAAIGLALPAVITLSIITVFYQNVRNNIYVTKALIGVRAAVVPIILHAVIKLKKIALSGNFSYIVASSSLALCLFTDIRLFYIILFAGIIGFIRFVLQGRRKNGTTA